MNFFTRVYSLYFFLSDVISDLHSVALSVSCSNKAVDLWVDRFDVSFYCLNNPSVIQAIAGKPQAPKD